MEQITLIGFERETALVKKLLQNNAIPHAFLLVGKKSIGKSIFARKIAAYIAEHRAIEDRKDIDLTKLHRDFLSNTYPDLHVITEEEDKTKISVEQTRELLQSTSLTSYHGIGTYIIIQNIEKLSIAAANALLKSLEEPASHTYYILSTSQLHLVPETILSRTFQINCSHRTSKELNQILHYICGDSEIVLKDNILKIMDGSLELILREEEFDKKSHLPLDTSKTKSTVLQNITELENVKARASKILNITSPLDRKSQVIQFFRTSEKNEYVQNCKINILFAVIRDEYIQNPNISIDELNTFQELIEAYSDSQVRNLDIELQLSAVI